ncbi:hypothetical protein DRW03_20510 [Corallococcus sp. H22C18031201]|uniref:hypothetical protein n=1 Tax=Citreicoccus inhibens TaxID=2849499 RepID=UPI000E737C54|nr:hypothetical protein [Citreicoccus inhibens]MBU8895717.1 hypothetical protein [Citreicoccus inhibens]RJS20140.1 hypothetical protein DRW03_20510 [Corallococcus sp. H22C18031201]
MKRVMRPLRRGVGILGVLVGAGVALAASRPDAIGLHIARESWNLVLTQDAISGPEFQLARKPGVLRGRTVLGDVHLTLTDTTVTGVVGVQTVNLKVKREGAALVAEGGFAGRPAELRLSPDGLRVYVRDCTYTLKAKEAGRVYEGRRSCDSLTVPESEISLPEEFLAAPIAEQAAVLLLAL